MKDDMESRAKERRVRRLAQAFAGLGSSLALAVALNAGQALAQDASVPPAANQVENSDIVVTAQRRSESVQKVPIAITALSGDALQNAGIKDTQQLSNLTPGLVVQRSIGLGRLTIRGVGNENYSIGGDPGVAVHSDGVYVARAAGGLFDFFDIDRVEVLRGPQGTLYGRNATGGVINVIPNTPKDDFEGRVGAEIGNYDSRRIDAMINVPLGQNLAVRVAGLRSVRDGFQTNTNEDARARGFGRLDDKDVWAVRGQIGTTGGGPFQARLNIENLHDDSNSAAYKFTNRPDGLPASADFGGGDAAFEPRNLRVVNQGMEPGIPGSGLTFGSDSNLFKAYQFGASLHLSYDFGGVKLSSISAYRNTRFNYLLDADGADIFYVTYGQQDKTKQYSQELQLSGGNDRLDWILGGFYFREKGTEFVGIPFPSGANLPFYIVSDGSAKTNALAGFGELRWSPTDRLKITVGARYSHEKRSADYDYVIDFGSPVHNPNSLDATFNAFTPRFVLNYEASSTVNLYASATRGFKSGGFNLIGVQPGFKPEKVWAFEGGIKAQAFDRRITANASIFYYKYDDIQANQVVNNQSVIRNAAKATLKGAEVEITARPVQALELGTTVAYLDAKYDRFCTGDATRPEYGTAAGPAAGYPAVPDAGCNAGSPINLEGNAFPRSPRWAVTGSATYTLDLSNAGSIILHADARYQSKVYFTQYNQSLLSQKGYVTANARLTWKAPGDKITFGAFVDNIFDKTYFSEIYQSGSFNPQLIGQAVVAPPRLYGLSASYAF